MHHIVTLPSRQDCIICGHCLSSQFTPWLTTGGIRCYTQGCVLAVLRTAPPCLVALPPDWCPTSRQLRTTMNSGNIRIKLPRCSRQPSQTGCQEHVDFTGPEPPGIVPARSSNRSPMAAVWQKSVTNCRKGLAPLTVIPFRFRREGIIGRRWHSIPVCSNFRLR